MSDTSPRSGFIRRFDALCARMRLVQAGRAVCVALLLCAAGLALLAAGDYFFELSRGVRAAGLAVLGTIAVAALGTWLVAAVRHWNRQGTAVEVERRFPELGQSVRTAVQYGSRPEVAVREGVTPSLLAALEDETDRQTHQLGVEEIVPVGRLQRAALAALVAAGVLLAAAAVSWEWRTATMRTLLAERPWTRLEVKPGDAVVDAGGALPVTFALHGRTDRPVVLQTRPTRKKNADWSDREFDPKEATNS